MAIDPSIALDVTQPTTNPLSMYQTAVSTAQGIQNIRNEQAALPGIQADSAIKKRAANFNNFLMKNTDQFTNSDSDADGNTVVGTKKLDVGKLIQFSAASGYLPEAQSLAASDLANKAQVLANGQTQANTQGTQINNANNAQALAISTRGYVSTFMDAYQKQNPAATPDQLDQQYNKLINGAKDQYKGALDVDGVFGTPEKGPSGQGPASYRYNPIENKAMLTSTMTPTVQTDLAQRWETINQSGVSGQSGPEWRDPESAISKQARQAAIAAGADTGIVGNMSAAQLATDKSFGGAVMASILPATAREKYLGDQIQHQQNSNLFLNGQIALEDLAGKIDPADKAAFNASPTTWITSQIQNRVAKYTNLPEFQQAQYAFGNVGKQNAQFPMGVDAGSLSTAFKNQARIEAEQAGISGAAAKSGTFNRASTASSSATQPTPAVNAGGTVKMYKNGKTYNIPAGKQAAAKSAGYTSSP